MGDKDKMIKSRRLFVNLQAPGCEVETLGEFDNQTEAERCLKKHRSTYPRCRVWLSSKPCKGWDNG
jgi:hypothetical protein